MSGYEPAFLAGSFAGMQTDPATEAPVGGSAPHCPAMLGAHFSCELT